MEYKDSEEMSATKAEGSQVTQALRAIEVALEAQEQVIGELNDKLKAVLLVRKELHSEKEDSTELVPLAHTLTILWERIGDNTRRLESILKAIQL